MTDTPKRELTLSEKAVNWAKAVGIVLPLVGAAVISTLGWFKSDDAQVGVDVLMNQLSVRVAKQEKVINVQSEKLEKMLRRMVFFQAHQEGFSSGQLYEKNTRLEQQLEAALRVRVSKAPVKRMPTPDAAAPTKPAMTSKTESMQQQQKIPRIKSKPFKRKD